MNRKPNFNKIRPKFSIYLLSKLLVATSKCLHYLVILGSLLAFRLKSQSRSCLVVVECGKNGWTLIEYEELFASATEYLGTSKVLRISITDRNHYLREVRTALRMHPVTHYVYDPRTGVQTWPRGLTNTLSLVVLFAWYKVIPIARLSDMPYQKWRIQCAVVTSVTGLCTTLMLPAQMSRYFPHRRLIGPMMMALSNKKVHSLVQSKSTKTLNQIPRAIFTGAMYEPRESFLRTVQEGLQRKGLDLEFETRVIGNERSSNDLYWDRLLCADIVITTADQLIGLGAEPMEIPHLVYRYSEVLAAGAMLVAPLVPGIDKYFRPGIDFAIFSSSDEAVAQIEFYLRSEVERRAIAESGLRRLRVLTESQSYWRSVDIALGTDGFNQPTSSTPRLS